MKYKMRNKKEIKSAISDENFNWLGREEFIEDFKEYLLSRKHSEHICLEGVWGSGKTTTILGLINKLENIQEQKPLVLYLDSWKYEHYKDPIFALLKVIEEKEPEIMESIKKEFEGSSLELQVGLNLPTFNISTLSNKSDEAIILNSAEYIDKLNTFIIKVLKKYKDERSNVLIIFIDELDRAKPDFALRTLEMFHHLQDELPTHIVYSVDMNQLNSMIKHYYGYEYNSEIFVHKVFDIIYPLKELSQVDIEDYIVKKLLKEEIEYHVETIASIIMNYMSITQSKSLRTINKLTENIALNLKKGYFKEYERDQISPVHLKYYLSRDIWCYIELLVILEIISLTDPMVVRNGIRGKKIKDLIERIYYIIIDSRNGNLDNLINNSLNFDKKDSEEDIQIEIKESNKEDILTGLYKIFNKDENNFNNKPVFMELYF